MNSSPSIQTGTIPLECSMYDFLGGVPAHYSTHAYSVMVINIIILVVTCPLNVVLNVLTMVAVKMKVRLQSMSNIVLACLATTDVMVGVLAQPLDIAVVIAALHGEATSDVCRLQTLTKYLMNFLCFSSLAHLVLMSADRYMAIKQSYTYEQTVTKTRVLIASTISWIFTTMVLVVLFIDHDLFLSIQNSLIVIFMLLITICTVVVYCEARRHEKQIAAQQFSVEAKERFLKEKRALRLTITIIVIVFLNYLPVISFRVIKNALQDRVSPATMFSVYTCMGTLLLLNSFINPLIYSVRLRQFRVAFIEIILKKTRSEAEEFEKKMFGSRNAAPNVESNEGGETEEHVNRLNENIVIETNQRGEREEQDVNQVNAYIDIETNQEGETEERDCKHLNANIVIGTKQGGETVEQIVNQVNANIDIKTNQEGETGKQDVNQVNVIIDIETNQEGETEKRDFNHLNANIVIETNQEGEREEQDVNQVNANIVIETKQGGASCEPSKN